MSEQQQLTAEQIAHRKIMDDVNKAYGAGTPISPVNKSLKNFAEKIALKGFVFDPREICKMIDAEAKKQYQDSFNECFGGQHLDTLTAAKDETIKWFQEEEVRFSAFKEAYLKGPEELIKDIPAPVFDNVTSIKKKGKK